MSIHQSVSQPIFQSINQSINQCHGWHDTVKCKLMWFGNVIHWLVCQNMSVNNQSVHPSTCPLYFVSQSLVIKEIINQPVHKITPSHSWSAGQSVSCQLVGSWSVRHFIGLSISLFSKLFCLCGVRTAVQWIDDKKKVCKKHFENL